jgi:Ca2+:H+ antiporter
MARGSLAKIVRQEWFLAAALGTSLVFFLFGDRLIDEFDETPWLAGIFVWLFVVILGSALSVVRHADHVAVRLGEPYGTLVLTLSITSIEVISISTAMLHGQNDPALARDTIFSVVMIIMNGMIGLSLLVGGLRHREQSYNLQGANTYLSVIVPLTVLALVLPDYTQTTSGPTLAPMQEAVLVVISIGLYAAFLAIQTGRHRSYFIDGTSTAHAAKENAHPILFHVVLLALFMAAVAFLAERLGEPLDYLVDTLHVPSAIGGLSIAILVAAPEAVGAVRAAAANQLQRSVNIFLGSVLSTIGLTIPAMVVVSGITGHPIYLGLEHTDLVMLLLTLAVSIVTFTSGRTNILQGLVHLLLFATYAALIFES